MFGSRLACLGARRGRQTPDHRDEAERDELVSSTYEPADVWARDPKYYALYRCVWVEAGETKYSLAGQRWRAQRVMTERLSRGFPAWLEEMPFTDDDVPF